MSLTIMQGDQYAIPFVGKLNGEPLDLTHPIRLDTA
mgnify:CR=1 FL=1